jgi:hypothetical protein
MAAAQVRTLKYTDYQRQSPSDQPPHRVPLSKPAPSEHLNDHSERKQG